jgi:hypothetical protein
MTLTVANVSESSDCGNENDVSNTEIKSIDLSVLLDDSLLLNTVFRYSSAKDLARFRRASSCFHPHIQRFWYRFNPRQQIYYLTKYALEILAKKHRPFQLQQIKQALRDGVLTRGVWLFSVSQIVAWLFGCLLPEEQDYPVPQVKHLFLSSILNLFRYQYYGNERQRCCKKSYCQALEHIGSMSKPMEPLLKILVLSVFYKPGDLLKAFKKKRNKKNLFLNLDVVVTTCGEKNLPAVVNVFRPLFKKKSWRIRWAVADAWVKIPLYYPGYSKKAWANPLYLRLLDSSIPCVSPSVIYASVDVAKHYKKRQLSKLLAAVIFLFDDEHWEVSKAAIATSINLVQYCHQEQFTDLTNGLIPRLKDDRREIRNTAINVWIKMAENKIHQGWWEWIKPLCLLFTVKNYDVRLAIVRSSPKIAKLCGKQQFTDWTSGLLSRLQDDDLICRAAIHAVIEIEKTNPKQGWRGWIKPLSVLFKAKHKFVRRAIVKASADIAKLCNKDQYAELLLALRACLRDEDDWVRNAAVRAWVEIGKSDSNRQCDEWIKPLYLLLLEKDDSIRRSVIEEYPEIAKYCDEKQFEDRIIKIFLNTEAWVWNFEEILGCSEKMTIHCKKERFSTLMQSLFVSAKNTDENTNQNAIMFLGGMAKHGDKSQFASLISELFFWMSDNIPKDYDDNAYDSSDAYHLESKDDSHIKISRRRALIFVLVKIAKYCNKEQFENVLKIAFSCLRDVNVKIRELTLSLMCELEKHCDKEQSVELITALVRCLADGYNKIEGAREETLDEIVGYIDEYTSFGWSQMFWYYLSRKYTNGCYDWNARKAAIQICAGMTKHCDKKPFLALMVILLSELKNTGRDQTARIISKIDKSASADQRKEILNLLVAGEVIDLNVIPIIQDILLFNYLSGIPIDQKLYQRLVQLKIIQKKQKDFRAVINGYLPRRVYALRKRIRPNPRYSTEVSVARETLFSQSNKKRKARTTEPDKQLKVTAKRPRQ